MNTQKPETGLIYVTTLLGKMPVHKKNVYLDFKKSDDYKLIDSAVINEPNLLILHWLKINYNTSNDDRHNMARYIINKIYGS